MMKLYSLISGAIDCPADDPRVVEIADVVERLMIRAAAAGETGADGVDNPFVDARPPGNPASSRSGHRPTERSLSSG